jgi:hypothetical protein
MIGTKVQQPAIFETRKYLSLILSMSSLPKAPALENESGNRMILRE